MGSSIRNIAPETAWARGVTITHTARAIGRSVAEYVLGLMLMLLHGFDRYDRALKDGADWPVAHRTWTQDDLADQRVGLVGLGAVGTVLATRLRAMGTQVAVFDPFITDKRAVDLGLIRTESLEELFARCDIVSLHAGLTDQTRHMVGEAQLAAMKPGSILINAGRGGLVDTQALTAAVQSKHIRAALDVFEDEPLPLDHPLRSLDNVMLSPHVAGFCNRSTYARCAEMVVEDVLRIVRGQPARNVVTPEMHRRST